MDKLAYGWLSDPWLEFIAYLCGLLFLSIFWFIFIIVYKFYKRQSIKRHQNKISNLLTEIIKQPISSAQYSKLINQLNLLSHNKPINSLIAWVGIMEDSNQVQQTNFSNIFSKLAYTELINIGLNSRDIASQCLALQMIRLSELNQFDEALINRLNSPDLAPYAVAALARTQGIKAIDLMMQCYENDYLSNTQLLTAFVELPINLLKKNINKTRHPQIHLLISKYLERPA